MIYWESSLRLPVLVAGVGAIVLALGLAASAQAAGGSPLPAPDDPPPGLELTRTKVVRTVPTTRPTKEAAPKKAATTPASSTAVPVPTPDAPLESTSAPQTPPASSAPDGAQTERAVSVAPKVSRRSAPRPAVRVAAAPVVAEVATPTPTRITTPPARAARSEPSAPAKKRSSRPEPKPLATQGAEPPVPVARIPHDALRVGIPIGALIVGRPGSDPDAGLLVLAAMLLVTVAVGTLVLGLAARGAARHA